MSQIAVYALEGTRMSAKVLVSGTIFRNPERRSTKAGKPFVTATMKVRNAGDAQWWRVTAFSESIQDELAALAEGDALAVQGTLRADMYTREGGESRISLSVVADQILAFPKKTAASKGPRTARSRAPRENGSSDARARQWLAEHGEPDLNDDIPF